MSGFSTIVGFMLSFFIIIGVFLGTFYTYQQGIIEQSKLIDSVEKSNYLNSVNYGYETYQPFIFSGRMNLYFENTGENEIKILENDKNCFDFYYDTTYVNQEDFLITPKGYIPSTYSVIDENDIGLLFLKTFDYKNGNLKTISCDGIDKKTYIDFSKIDWWDTNWQSRKIIDIKNNLNKNLPQYQIETNLNSTNFDFSLANENELRILIPLKELLILDLNFDNYNQELKDYSNHNLDAYLGKNNLISNDDPTKTKGVIFDGLKFNGSQFINISSNNVLEQTNSITYSAWIKWNNSGGVQQNIITNGADENSLQIVNDGGINDNKILFKLNIDGTSQSLYSDIQIDEKWNHIVSTYDGTEMKIYVNSILTANKSIEGGINTYSNSNYIGSGGNYALYNGLIDEVKIFALDLNENEIKDLYHNNLRFRELDFYISKFDKKTNNAKIFSKIPTILANSNLSIHLYYNNIETSKEILTKSNIISTFSYNSPQTIGYVVSDRISSTTGLSIYSLENNNTIKIGTNEFNLNEQQTSTLSTANIEQNDSIKLKHLTQIEGNGNADDMIVPISWASTSFYYRGFRDNTDRFCMLSPFGSASVKILDDGVLEWSGDVDNSGFCVNNDIATNNALAIHSDIPILVHYEGSGSNDAFAFYPATKDDLYGIPSNNGYIASGPTGASGSIILSDGSTSSFSYGAYGTGTIGSGHGTAPGHKITTNDLIGIIQQADLDGTESTVFVPEYEMSTKFGSALSTEYITLVSPYENANCSTYDNSGNIFETIENGVGTNGVYKYDFGTGNSNNYLTNGFKIECDKPVWGYYEEDSDGDETNMLGYSQMRQYVYPEPSVNIR
ncbi:MAG: DUF2341 domain-containing protein [Nanoarchaeota archaeon]